MVLVGNKADMRDQRVVKEAEAQEISKQLGTVSAARRLPSIVLLLQVFLTLKPPPRRE